jgi:hypothetical protein
LPISGCLRFHNILHDEVGVADENKPEDLHLTNGALRLEVPVNGIVLVEVK